MTEPHASNHRVADRPDVDDGLSFAAERRWQTGTWGDVTTKRRLIDFGPGASPFGRPGSATVDAGDG